MTAHFRHAPARRCKRVRFGMRLRGYFPAGATVVH